ncbi:hypothetical protein [Sinomonas sp. G460-2]|uniref:hypothetical protein n=1 Tax=Sinomonas sp. G460-2 TaxID=3393464 RepID=UPI0039EFEECD
MLVALFGVIGGGGAFFWIGLVVAVVGGIMDGRANNRIRAAELELAKARAGGAG